jgi:hypothetical protein
MVIRGRVRNGVVVPDEPGALPEGAAVCVALVNETAAETKPASAERREGGWWRGRVRIADDFDELPDDLAEAFGVRTP